MGAYNLFCRLYVILAKSNWENLLSPTLFGFSYYSYWANVYGRRGQFHIFVLVSAMPGLSEKLFSKVKGSTQNIDKYCIYGNVVNLNSDLLSQMQ